LAEPFDVIVIARFGASGPRTSEQRAEPSSGGVREVGSNSAR
jgi:hypothetical protein